MRVLGIDCGSQHTGYGVVELDRTGNLHCIAVGAIHNTTSTPIADRLNKIFRGLQAVIERDQPEEVAIEDVFFAVNVKSALKLGHVRGVAMLAASAAGLTVAEYAPLSIKSAVVGYGRADKEQVQHMITRLLNLEAPPDSPDAADALAIAICHLHTSASLRRQQAVAAR
jgi:crossover junction endodeoxyribonuclease RuvC